MRQVILFLAAIFVNFFMSSVVFCSEFLVSNVTELRNALITAAANNQNGVINVNAGTYNVSTVLLYDTSQNYSLEIKKAARIAPLLD